MLNNKDQSKVYFIRLDGIKKIKNVLPQFNERLAVKVHFGEEGNKTFVPAVYIQKITDMLDSPALVETGVLYKSVRSTAAGHKELAKKHGFDFAPVDILDGEEGDNELVSYIDGGKHFRMCFLAAGLRNYDSLLALSHFKGHGGAKFGGAIKNLGMGLACRMGKLAIHSSIKHSVKTEKCVSCGACIDHCPVQAIEFKDNQKALIDQEICISCSKCISVCPQSAVRIPWDSTGTVVFQERLAEYAKAAVGHRQVFFVNFLMNITFDCDCCDSYMEKLTPDIGLLVSADPVAIDQASYDMVLRQYSDFKNYYGEAQLSHGEKIGLGKRTYRLIQV